MLDKLPLPLLLIAVPVILLALFVCLVAIKAFITIGEIAIGLSKRRHDTARGTP